MSESVTIDPGQLHTLTPNNADPFFDFLNLDDIAQPYLSEAPSLSPASQSSFLRQHSPSTASPRSIFSASDELSHDFTSAELDQLFATQMDVKPAFNGFYLPPATNVPTLNVPDMASAYQNLFTQNWPTQLPQAEVVKVEPIRKRPAREDSVGSDARSVGKHNKTERRYRQKVQEAQSNLRDAVPALRVLYGTSSEEQKRTTDIRAPDGTVDGLGEFNRPNASAKTTIFVGARLYIEHLQRKVATLQRQVDELAAFRAAVAGPENLQQWRADFEVREAVYKAAAQPLDDCYDDESEDEKPTKKKPRMTKKNARSFAAFAAAFTLLPFMRSSTTAILRVETRSASTSQVFRRFPLIVAEHAVRLLDSVLPSALVPSPSFLVEWILGSILVAIVFTVLRVVWRTIARSQVLPSWSARLPPIRSDIGESFLLVEKAVGKLCQLSFIQRYYLALRLNATAKDAQSLALLALFQHDLPLLPTGVDLWARAKAALVTESPSALRQVLALDLAEAERALALLPPTTDPITAIAEQVTLVHLNDLFSRFFVRLVDNATGQNIPASVQALQMNIRQRMMGTEMSSSRYDKEVRSVVEIAPRGTAARALALVLVGLWGIIAGAAPSAQASLASALAGEEVKGVGASLASVGALRELLYPGSGLLRPTLAALPANAMAIDKLALVCIRFIQLLSNSEESVITPHEKLDLSRRVERSAAQIRLVLAETTFAGMNEEASSDSFDDARDRLVTVLSLVGRNHRNAFVVGPCKT